MRGRVSCLVLLVVLLLGCALGCTEKKGEPARAVAKSAALARLAPRLSQTPANLTPVTRSDGRRSLRVNGGFSQAQMARLGADGRVTTVCVDNLAAADAMMIEGAKP
jgi:hypothetical protein